MTTKRILTLAAVGTLAAMSSVAISMATWLNASAAPNAVRLHLGTDAQQFIYGTTVQPIEVGKNTCAITKPSAQTVINLSATSSGNAAPGLANYGLGVKGSPSSGNGSPCAQIDPSESLTITPGSALGSRSFTGARLDLELTGNAIAVVTVSGAGQSQTYRMQSGTSIDVSVTDNTAPYQVASGPGDTNATVACAAPNSSGPNSGPNDNCQWSITPGFNFTTLTITSTTSGSTVSLEGGGDYGNDPAFETLFMLSNSAPSAVNDSVTTNEDTAVGFNVLTNDSDPDGDTLSLTGNTSPAHGTLTSGATAGAFNYTPASNYNGSDSFQYTISDGTSSATATVTITVRAVNDPPVANNSSPTTPEETPITITVGADVDSTALTSTCSGVPPVGTIVDNGNGTITFTPPLDFVGSVTITCTIRDDQGATSQSSATVNVTVSNVNDPPVAANDTASVNENTSTQATSVLVNVLANDSDVDNGDTLTPSAVSAPQHGTAVVEGTSIRYTPNLNYVGPDTFTYRASDHAGAQSAPATVSIDVIRVMCSGEEVSDSDAGVNASFILLTSGYCKPYTIDARADTSTVLFQPVGTSQVDYRGVVTFGPRSAQISAGALVLLLQYDPAGGTAYQPVQLCSNPVFDANGKVTAASIPVGETWCVASETTIAGSPGQVTTTWQVFGHDDPQFH